MDLSEIIRLLSTRINELVPVLLPNAIRIGHEWRIGSVAGARGRSMAIHAGDGAAGVWADFSNPEYKGDALDLVAFVNFNGDKKQALAWAKGWLGLDNMDATRLKTVRKQTQKELKRAEREEQKKTEHRARFAKALYLGAQPILPGSPVDSYMLCRGISFHDMGRTPRALRYAPSVEYPAKMNNGLVTSWPCMVAAIVNGQGYHIATHRTFLQDRGGRLVVKAPVPDAKLTIGSYRGGFIPIWRGASGKSLRKAPEGDKVILCEGIEDGLSIAYECPEFRVLACVSVGNFQKIELPPQIRDVYLARDNDVAGSPADKALMRAADVLFDQGRNVAIMKSPVGKDFNDARRAAVTNELSIKKVQFDGR